jgi:hypothetical protein
MKKERILMKYIIMGILTVMVAIAPLSATPVTDKIAWMSSPDGNHLDEMPYYSPDGKYIIFKRGGPNGENLDIYRMSPDGSNLTNLTNTSSLNDIIACYQEYVSP